MSQTLQERVSEIEKRNQRVAADKAWETSWTRRLVITVLTYITIALYLRLRDNPNAFLDAAIPATGFLLSTLVIGVIKRRWVRSAYEK